MDSNLLYLEKCNVCRWKGGSHSTMIPAEYRQRLARRIGLALSIIGILSLRMAAVTS